MKNRTKVLSLSLTILMFVFTATVNAKNDNGNNGKGVGNVDKGITGTNNIPGNCGNGKPNGNACGGGDSIPLDGGVSLLVLAGAAFGARKLRKI